MLCSNGKGDNCGQWGDCSAGRAAGPTHPGNQPCSPCRGAATLDGLLTCDGLERPRSVWWSYKAYASVGDKLFEAKSTRPAVADGVFGLASTTGLVTASIGVLGRGCPGNSCPGNDTTALTLHLLNLPSAVTNVSAVEASAAIIDNSGVQPRGQNDIRIVKLAPTCSGSGGGGGSGSNGRSGGSTCSVALEALPSGTAAFVAVGPGAAAAVAAFAKLDPT